MERIVAWSNQIISSVELKFKRYLHSQIAWNNRLIVLVGARGVGKTTLLLQYIKENLPLEDSLYASLDDIYFSRNSLLDFVEKFSQQGGQYLFLDEVHKYKNWSVEIKSLYDHYPDIKFVLSGSSAVELLKSEGDLSRRALFYTLHGLSFREFVLFHKGHDLPTYSLDDILKNHLTISLDIRQRIKPIKLFSQYLKFGYYPFFKEDIDTYHHRLSQVINTVLEIDIPSVYSIDGYAVRNVKKLLALISDLVPFKPNVKKLSAQIGISRDSLIRYLKQLEKANIIHLLYSHKKGITLLNKPEKIYLNNSNIAYTLSSEVNKGSLRESFFMNQLSLNHSIKYSGVGDFLIDNQWTFEVGGKGKSGKQITSVDNAWVVADHMESSVGNKIPLWLFGFLY